MVDQSEGNARDKKRGCLELCIVRRVLKCRLVRAASANREHEWAGVDVNRVAEELAAAPMVPGDHARDCLLIGDGLTHADLDLAAYSEPASSGGVVDLDLERHNAEQVGGLENPWELLARSSAKAPR
jgi:hypothetical protein